MGNFPNYSPLFYPVSVYMYIYMYLPDKPDSHPFPWYHPTPGCGYEYERGFKYIHINTLSCTEYCTVQYRHTYIHTYIQVKRHWVLLRCDRHAQVKLKVHAHWHCGVLGVAHSLVCKIVRPRTRDLDLHITSPGGSHS